MAVFSLLKADSYSFLGMKRVARVAQSSKGDRMSKVKSGSVWAWLVLIGCIGFYSIPTGIIANTSGIFVAPVMDQFGWSQTDTTMYRTIQPIVSAILRTVRWQVAGEVRSALDYDRRVGCFWLGLGCVRFCH